jgi:single-stranded DNA-binding protein
MISGSTAKILPSQIFDRQNEPGVDPFLIEVIISGSVAEHGPKFLKGRPLPLDGYLLYRIWKERNSGQQRRTHAVLARSVKCLARLGVVNPR